MIILMLLLLCSPASAEEIFTNESVMRELRNSAPTVSYATPKKKKIPLISQRIRERKRAIKKAQGRLVCGDKTESKEDKKGHRETCIELPDEWVLENLAEHQRRMTVAPPA